MVALGGWIGGVPAINLVGRDVPRQQCLDVLGHLRIGQFTEQDAEISLWMVAVDFCCLCRKMNYAEQLAPDFMKVLVPLPHKEI